MRKILLSTTCTGLLLLALPVRAQTVNYGALADIFGEPVTTSATGKPQKASDVPADMEIVTQDDIRRSGADNIPDVLQYLTGMNFRRNGFNEPELSIRGFDEPWNPRLLVLINGQPVYEDFFGDVVWAALPVQLDEIRQIEVVKGPTAALFGFNAVSGVINIVTYDPMYDDIKSVTARGGSQALKEGSAVATLTSNDQYGLRLSAGGQSSDEFKTTALNPAQRLSSYLAPFSENVAFDGRARLSDSTVMSLNGYESAMRRNFLADGQIESDRTWSLRGQITNNSALGLANLDVYWTRWTFDFPILQQATSETRDIRASDLFQLGTDHTIRLSAEYKYNSANGQYAAGSTDFYNIYSFGAMWDWQVSPSLSVTNAVREDYLTLGIKGGILPYSAFGSGDYNNRVLNATSFNSGIVYRVSPEDVVRLLVSRGYQLPSLDVLGMQLPQGGNVDYLGDPHTQATQVTNYEADYDRDVSPLGATLRTALFHQTNFNLFNFLIVTPNFNAADLMSTNTGSSNETGAEITLKSKAGAEVRWSIGYSYATISDHAKSGNGTVLAEPFSVYHNGTPASTLNASIGHDFGPLEIDLRGGWRSHYQDWGFSQVSYTYIPVTTKDYTTLDLHASYKLTDQVRLGLTVDNLTQANTYERATSVPVQRRVFLSATASF